jgi:predicted amidohydrolase YtcJ
MPLPHVEPARGCPCPGAGLSQLEKETTKGTLEAGKLADLVILGKNPLKVDPVTIKDIAVVETISGRQDRLQK